MHYTFVSISLLVSILLQSDYKQEIKAWQDELNASFADPEESPLDKKERKKFESLEFFPIDPAYRVVASFKRTPNEMPFNMPTTTERLPVYVKYGEAHFQLEGEDCSLALYKSHSLSLKDGYEDYLFLPFTDPTNGFESYGGGRYIDARIPEGDSIVIDFNTSYNPYCAYSSRYSCPVPPLENDLPVDITAGVKVWKNH